MDDIDFTLKSAKNTFIDEHFVVSEFALYPENLIKFKQDAI